MSKKPARRTAERILEVCLSLFNRFGEPNVSTTLISAELRISPGNLYYHYPSKEELINTLFLRYESKLNNLLLAGSEVKDVEDAWFFFNTLFQLIGQYSFLYRDLNNLLSNNRLLELHFQSILSNKKIAIQNLLESMQSSGAFGGNKTFPQATSTSMVVILTYWLSYEYVREPRTALESSKVEVAIQHGVSQALHLLMPHLEVQQREHLMALISTYDPSSI